MAYEDRWGGDVFTPDSVTVVHFGSPVGTKYTEPEEETDE
jgi:hypothetical protein